MCYGDDRKRTVITMAKVLFEAEARFANFLTINLNTETSRTMVWLSVL